MKCTADIIWPWDLFSLLFCFCKIKMHKWWRRAQIGFQGVGHAGHTWTVIIVLKRIDLPAFSATPVITWANSMILKVSPMISWARPSTKPLGLASKFYFIKFLRKITNLVNLYLPDWHKLGCGFHQNVILRSSSHEISVDAWVAWWYLHLFLYVWWDHPRVWFLGRGHQMHYLRSKYWR